MKRISILFLLFFLSSLYYLRTYSQTTARHYNLKSFVGQYKSSDGSQFIIRKDGSFFILKGHNKFFDAAIAGCDTISKGYWHFFSESAIKLANDKNFRTVKFTELEENKFSKDSIYLKIELPKDDAFFDGRFKYQIIIMGRIDFLESTKSMIAIPKKKVFENGDLYYHLGLMIQDLSPLNCKLNGKCYQRIYFNIIDDYGLNTKSNYFTIRLTDFNNCYVECADVDNQLVFITDSRIHWQDIDFTRVR
jgi:hypothetical protein